MTYKIDNLLLQKVNNIFTLNIYDKSKTINIDNITYRIIGDDGHLSIAIASNEVVYAINKENKCVFYLQKNLELFKLILEKFVELSDMSDVSEEDKLKIFINNLRVKDSQCIKQTSWWYCFLSDAIIDGVNIDTLI